MVCQRFVFSFEFSRKYKIHFFSLVSINEDIHDILMEVIMSFNFFFLMYEIVRLVYVKVFFFFFLINFQGNVKGLFFFFLMLTF